ncbi:MAG TPA: GNAT family N-acetyltransferase [Rheinheimera sp.]|uniref:GNAT family N-acetyltransferase n=1 Tax=Rheinheimera sp. TaxID=1869214 RepID=UPI002B4A504E|nr:GNAT family N-acetyltransferase [Rheinheimera sp.]HJS15685.1 GNAT family N-acetyltransferase [Rheinheimera sp.]
MYIEALDPLSAPAAHLLALSDAYMASLYPAESNHMESPSALALPNVLFLGAYLDGELAGCGAVKLMHDDGSYGEIKRVYVLDTYRGRGLSKQLMQALESHLIEQQIPLARLETGISQPEALGLYEKLGYQYRTPFGSYLLDPLSVFMEKRL